MTFAAYLKAVFEAKDRYPMWRMGQTYFNVLHHTRPDLSEQVRAGELDPFYNDDRIDSFLMFVVTNW